VAFALVLGILSLLPYLLASVWSPPGRHFTGFFFIADDAATYLAKMREGADGSWLWSDPYTSEPHQGVFLFGFYLLFGHLAALTHVPLIAMYHLARLSGGAALILGVDRLAHRLLPPAARRTALVLVVLGSGLGFVAQMFNDPTVAGQKVEALDLHLPELSGWYSMLAIPHFTWAAALIAFALLGLLRLRDAPSLPMLAATALTLTLLTAIHPQMLPVLGLVWAGHHLLRLYWGIRPRMRSLLAEAGAFIVPTPLLAYNTWVLFRDPTIAQWGSQWRHQAPGVLSLALSLGVTLILAVIGMRAAWRRRDGDLALLLVWPPVVLALLYLPNVANIQRRLLDALYLPIGILAAVGIKELGRGTARLRAARRERLLIAGCCLSSVLVFVIALRFAGGALPEAYISADEAQALSWLSEHHAATDRVLSSPQTGLLIPAWTGVPVYVGHYSETLDYFKKIHRVEQVLAAGVPPVTVQAFFAANGITLLYWGPEEKRSLSMPVDPDGLIRVYEAGAVAIYQVHR